MKKLLYILLVLTSGSMLGQEEKVLTAMANSAYHNENYNKADSLYTEALKIDSSFLPAKYNRALVLYRLEEFEDCVENFEILSKSSIDSIASNSLFNLSNAELKIWMKEDAQLNIVSEKIKESKIDKNDDVEVKMAKFILKDSLIIEQKKLIQSKEKRLDKVIEGYKSCLRINPSDDDARYNLMYARKLLPVKKKSEEEKKKEREKKESENQESSEYAKKTYLEVLRLIGEYDFQKAYNLLSEGMNKDDGMKKYSQLSEKLKIINSIIEK